MAGTGSDQGDRISNFLRPIAAKDAYLHWLSGCFDGVLEAFASTQKTRTHCQGLLPACTDGAILWFKVIWPCGREFPKPNDFNAAGATLCFLDTAC